MIGATRLCSVNKQRPSQPQDAQAQVVMNSFDKWGESHNHLITLPISW